MLITDYLIETIFISLTLVWSYISLLSIRSWQISFLAIIIAEFLLYLIFKLIFHFWNRHHSRKINKKHTLELIFLGLIIFQLVGAAGGFNSPAIILIFIYLIPLVFITRRPSSLILYIFLLTYLYLITPHQPTLEPFPFSLFNANFFLSSEFLLIIILSLFFILLHFAKNQNLVLHQQEADLISEKSKVTAYNKKAEAQQANIFSLVNNQKSQTDNFQATIDDYLLPRIHSIAELSTQKKTTKQDLHRELSQLELQLKKISRRLLYDSPESDKMKQ